MAGSPENDPFGVVPDGFCDAWGADTIPEGLERAERAPSSTPEEEHRRCPVCGSVRVRKKIKRRDVPNARPEPFKCTSCYQHFEKPITPNDPETMHGKSTTDDRVPFDWVGSADLKDPAERAPLMSQLDDDTLTAIAIRAYRPWTGPGPSYRQIAAMLPYSRQWVGERVRAWEAGEYRELVADPTAESGPEPEPIHEPDPFDYDRAVATDGGRHRRRWAAYGSD